jgi:hypothetical protein
MAGADLGSALGDPLGHFNNGDAHRADGVPAISGATGAGEGHERFAVGTRWCKQGGSGGVGLIDTLDRLLMVGVGGVKQSDQDTGVED